MLIILLKQKNWVIFLYWLQVGITNDEGLERARTAGLIATQDRCAMVVHRDEIATN